MQCMVNGSHCLMVDISWQSINIEYIKYMFRIYCSLEKIQEFIRV